MLRFLRVCFYFLILGTSTVLQAEALRLSVPDATRLNLETPTDWEKPTVENTGKNPSVFVSIDSDKAKSISMKITFFENRESSKIVDQSGIINFLEHKASAPYIGGSVEKAAKAVPIVSKNLVGAYTRFTDARFAGIKETKPPKYRYMTLIAILIGKTAGSVTIVSNSIDSPAYLSGLKFIEQGIMAK